jgi:EpsI family protein
MIKIAAALLILGLNSYVYWYLASEEVIPARENFASFPDDIDSWHCLRRETLDDEVIQALLVTDYISCTFLDQQSSEPVHLYVGYHERQTRDRDSGRSSAIHPPEHCLPGSGWDVIDAKLVPIEFGATGEAKRFVIAKGNQRSLVYFWYQSRGRMISRSHEKIFYMFMDRATQGRTDGSLVRFTVPIENGDIDEAERTFERFATKVSDRLPDYVPN